MRMLGTVCHAGCGSTPTSTIVLFMVLGAILLICGRRFTLWSLRPYFSKQRLAELDQPRQRRLRLFVNFSRGTGIIIGLFFVVTGIVSLLK